MNIKQLKRNPRMMLALTGISYQEFTDLVPVCSNILYEHYATQPDRKRVPGDGKKGHLKTTEDKLFFILFYLKTYPTFDVLAFFFKKGRGRSCEAVHLYLKVLERSLGKKIRLPERKINSVEEFLEKYPEVKDVFVDGTERRMEYPQDKKRNRRHYSGKKKGHTRKNVIVTNEQKQILLVSPTKPGRRHDKNCADRIQLLSAIPDNVAVWADSGFQGIHHTHANTLVAKRGRKNYPLTRADKAENHVISSFRIGVEHAIGGMKRYRCMRDVLRNKLGVFDDKIAVVTAALYNYRLSYAG